MCSNSSLLRARNVWTFIDSLTSESRVWNFDPQFVQKKKENKIESNSSPFRIPIIKKITREYSDKARPKKIPTIISKFEL